MTPARVKPASYLAKDQIERINMRVGSAHVVARNAAISFKTSVSLLVELSKPGVSMRTIGRSSRTNLSASSTSAVHDSRFVPIRRFDPLAKLTN